MAFGLAAVAVYGYVIAYSIWQMWEYRGVSNMYFVAYRYVAIVLAASLAIRLRQLISDAPAWLFVPMTIIVTLMTMQVLISVGRIAVAERDHWYGGPLATVRGTVLLGCVVGLVADQVWRVATLFWF